MTIDFMGSREQCAIIERVWHRYYAELERVRALPPNERARYERRKHREWCLRFQQQTRPLPLPGDSTERRTASRAHLYPNDPYSYEYVRKPRRIEPRRHSRPGS